MVAFGDLGIRSGRKDGVRNRHDKSPGCGNGAREMSRSIGMTTPKPLTDLQQNLNTQSEQDMQKEDTNRSNQANMNFTSLAN